MVPGLDVRTGSRGEARLSTRGLADRQMVVLVDGVPLSDPYTGSVNPSMVLAGALGKVRVTKGPVASVYGANALGGVVEVTTVAHERAGTGFRLTRGTDGRYSGHVSGGGRPGRFRVAGGVATQGRSDFSLPASYEKEVWEDGGLRDYSSRENLFAWGRASWRPGSRTDASVSLQVADARWDAPASTNSSRPRFWSFPYWREVRTTGSLAFRPNDSLIVESTIFYSTNDNDLASYDDLERTERDWLSSVANRAFGGYAHSEYRGLRRQRISGGLNVRGDVARLRDDVSGDWERYDSTTASVFAQDEVSISESDLVSVAMNVDVMSGEGQSLARFNPQVAYTRRLRGTLSARLLAGIKTRFPTLKEWFSPSIGNPDLKPEKSASVEIEFAANTRAGSVSLVGFRQSVEDMITTAGKGEPAENLESVTSLGAELAVDHRFALGFRVRLGLTAVSAKDDETDERIPLVPESSAMLLAAYERGPGELVVRVQSVGSRYGDDGDLPAYTLVGVRGSVKTRWGEFFAVAENVFDELYEYEGGFPGPGRSFEVGVARSLHR
jgi:iron complex outermembrane receptor protein